MKFPAIQIIQINLSRDDNFVATKIMQINQTGLNLIKESEGLRLEAYKCPAGIWTIGYGCTEGVKQGMTVSQEQAEAMLRREVAKFEAAVSDLVKVPLSENQFSALVSFIYNVGINAFANSTLLRFLNQGDYQSAQKEFARWNKGGGQVLAGLGTRREKERQLFASSSAPSIVLKGSAATIRVKNDTFLKSECQQASTLPEDKKVFLPAGTEFKVDRWQEQSSHYLVSGQKSGWIFKGHCELISQTPSATPTSLAERIVRYMEVKGYQVFKNPKEYNIVYVEGMNPSGALNGDVPNEFNDLRLVIEFPDGITPRIVASYKATTEPGAKYTLQPMNPKGAARIKFGQYEAWSVGYHGTGAGRHEALIQVMPITVCRDLDKNFVRTGDIEDTGLFGCNQHHGYDYPEDDIRGASAGCLVGRSVQGHREFMAIVKGDVRYEPGYIFFTTVIPGDELMKFEE